MNRSTIVLSALLLAACGRQAEESEVKLVGVGMDPDTYVAGQCADAVRGVEGKAKVYMGIGIDAPRSRPDTAKMTKDIAYRSVMATYRAGGHGIVLAPTYASMHLTHLDGVAEALGELGLR